MIHALKTTPQFFEDVTNGKKAFEVRKNDRDFRVCDYIALNEYDATKPDYERYSGRSALFQITYILNNPEYCKSEYVILGLVPCGVETIPNGGAIPVLYGQARGVTE